MYKGIAVALLAVGVALAIWGFSAMDSFSSDMSRMFTGSPTNKAVWLLASGGALVIVGAFGLFRSPKKI